MKKPIAVIGDIHGCLKPLVDIYEQIIQHTDEVYSVGDLIDRGANSKKVIQFCIDNNIKAVRGNHEDMMLKTQSNPRYQIYPGYETNKSHWIWNGGDMTMESYIGKRSKSFKKFSEEFLLCGHFDFISKLPLKIELDNCIISHGGIVNNQYPDSMLWNRNEPTKLGKIQIIGHTPNKDVIHKPNHYINVDTGYVFWGKLSAVLVYPNKEIKIISTS